MHQVLEAAMVELQGLAEVVEDGCEVVVEGRVEHRAVVDDMEEEQSLSVEP